MTEFIFYLDIFGTISFAVAASLMAYNKNLDPFGILVISIITSVGGGTLRDILLRNYPIFWIDNIVYLIVIIISSVLTQLFIRYISRISNILLIFDAIGIGVFTVIGIKISLNFHLHPLISITMGTITAVFGGLIRDVLYNEIPVILHKELYATLCITGGMLFFILNFFSIQVEINYAVSMLFIILTRIIAIKYNLSLKTLTFKR
ncbi:MAG TPA: trimeric intracellular cation channel family protein [Spirochaetota bacterium]|nr:trimeric intracellular cation channel family protein [Spirochaetota bacterium]HPS87313.1 trimeric intracellular cation channel family protein [Spirochaetota bacterium]